MGLNIDPKIAISFQPQLVAATSFIAGNATVIGHVELGAHSSVWFGSVLRGDSDQIIVGGDTNIQDLSVVHTDAGICCNIGSRVTVGHAANIHGAKVDDDVLIGMRSVILNRAHVGTGSIIAPGAIVVEGTIVPPNSVVMGVPGKVVRQTTERDRMRMESAWQHYRELAALHQNDRQ